MYLFCISCK